MHPSRSLGPAAPLARLALLALLARAGTLHAQSASAAAGPPLVIPPGVVEESITVGDAPWAVDGFLDRPSASGRAPAVVLIHGSGPATRDLDVGPSKVFREIGWGLASRGIVVVRYDKRSTAHAAALRETGRALSMDEEFTDDAVAAVKRLLARPDVDPRRVYVVGISQGAAVAPLVAERVPEVAGVILLSAGGRTPPELIREQVSRMLAATPAADTAARARALRTLADVARMEDGSLPDSVRVFNRTLAYWRSMLGLEPQRRTAELLARGGRALVVHGGRDDLTTDADYERWGAALRGKPRVTFRRFPELDHSMRVVGTDAEQERPGEYHPVSTVLLDDLARWLQG